MRIFCGDFTLDTVETFAFNWMFLLTVMGIIDACKQRPEWRSSGFADEPTSCIASELNDTMLEATQAEFFVRVVRIDFTKHVLITFRISHCMTISSMDFKNRFNNLQKEIIFKNFYLTTLFHDLLQDLKCLLTLC